MPARALIRERPPSRCARDLRPRDGLGPNAPQRADGIQDGASTWPGALVLPLAILPSINVFGIARPVQRQLCETCAGLPACEGRVRGVVESWNTGSDPE